MTAAEAARASRRAQGLPERVEDEQALDRIAAILTAGQEANDATS